MKTPKSISIIFSEDISTFMHGFESSVLISLIHMLHFLQGICFVIISFPNI